MLATDHWLHCVVVSHERPGLTVQTVESWQATTTIPRSLLVVDNGSTPETLEALDALEVEVLKLEENRYPGFAANRGFEQAPPQTTLLQRSDNDIGYLDGWCNEMVDTFDTRPEVGQYGVASEHCRPWTRRPDWPVGGNSIIRKALWDQGLRYTEIPWPELRDEGDTFEDHQLTLDVWELGWQRAFCTTPAIEFLPDSPGDRDYRAAAYRARGLSGGLP